jgi:hypothetical protein
MPSYEDDFLGAPQVDSMNCLHFSLCFSVRNSSRPGHEFIAFGALCFRIDIESAPFVCMRIQILEIPFGMYLMMA